MKDDTMRVLCTVLTLCLASAPALNAQSSDPAKLAEYLKSLPDPKPPAYDEVQRLALAANPLGCEDHPHASGGGGGAGGGRQAYLWQRDDKPQILEEYDKHRSFYGCLDWHSGVNSTWMMVSLIKADPTIAVAPAIRLELDNHFQKSNVDGELAYFTGLKGTQADFEKPYGYGWLLKLYGEAKTWDDPQGKKVATALEPLAKWMATQYVDYLHSLNYPIRVGLHPNTALDMGFVLDYTLLTHDAVTQTAIHDTALRLFGNDKHCATNSEPVFGDFGSPCLMEAALMGRVMDPQSYSKWLDTFLPPAYADEFQLYAKDIDAVHGNNRDTTGTDEEGLPNAHLIGLNFQRAADFMTIAQSLPKDDPRVPVYLRLATINGKQGYDKIGAAGYLGTHWLATYALLYENLVHAPAAASPNKTQVSANKK
jgi:Protein of unknown function (DUF2891)